MDSEELELLGELGTLPEGHRESEMSEMDEIEFLSEPFDRGAVDEVSRGTINIDDTPPIISVSDGDSHKNGESSKNGDMSLISIGDVDAQENEESDDCDPGLNIVHNEDTSGGTMVVSEEEGRENGDTSYTMEFGDDKAAITKQKPVEDQGFALHDLFAAENEATEDDEVTIVGTSEQQSAVPHPFPEMELNRDIEFVREHLRRNEASGDIIVEEQPAVSSKPRPRFNRLQDQMFRAYLERLSRQEPQTVIATYMTSEIQKCQANLNNFTSTLNTITKLQNKKVDVPADKMKAYYKEENSILKKSNEQLTAALNAAKASANNRVQAAYLSRNSYPNNGNSDLYRQVVATKRGRPSNVSFSTVTSPNYLQSPKRGRFMGTTVPSLDSSSDFLGSELNKSKMINNGVLKPKITFEVDLNLNFRQCPAHAPFDALPLRPYPIGLDTALLKHGPCIEIIINTGYDDFVLTKKIHGQIRYDLASLPGTPRVQDASGAMLYYWCESLNKKWEFAGAAKVSDSGVTKFSVCFHNEQKLFVGDRIAFVAAVLFNDKTKFVSDQSLFLFRRPADAY